MEVVQYREDETPEKVLVALMKDVDMAIPFDCADPRVQFVVKGWFICPKGSLTKPIEVTSPT